jgi:hypothetical protein
MRTPASSPGAHVSRTCPAGKARRCAKQPSGNIRAVRRGDGVAGPRMRPCWFGRCFSQRRLSCESLLEPFGPATPGDFRPHSAGQRSTGPLPVRPHGFDQHRQATRGQVRSLSRIVLPPAWDGLACAFTILRWLCWPSAQGSGDAAQSSCASCDRVRLHGPERDSCRDPEKTAGLSPLHTITTPACLPFQTSGTSPLEAGAVKLGAVFVDRKRGKRFPRVVHAAEHQTVGKWREKSISYAQARHVECRA